MRFAPIAAASGRCGSFWRCLRRRCLPSSSPTTGRSSSISTAAGIFRCFSQLSRDGFRRRFSDRSRLPRSRSSEADRRKGLDGVAADPVQLQHDQLQPAEPGAVAAIARQLARHRRPGPRRDGAADLWLSDIGVVRADPDRGLVGDRGRRRRRPGLFRRHHRSRISALYRDLVGSAGALSADHHGELCRAEFLAGCSG